MSEPRTDAATLAAAATSLEDLIERIVAVADRYRGTPSEDVAVDLYEVERTLRSGHRRLDHLVRERLG